MPAASCPAGVPVQAITVVNQANVRPGALARVERAVADQSLQLRAAWETPCVQFGKGGWLVSVQAGSPTVGSDGDVSVSIGGEHYGSGIPGPLWAGQPYAIVQTGGLDYTLWARAFSHELLEMLVDPEDVTRWRFGLLEVCDPVENYTYEVAGVQVSDFVWPNYFNGGAGPWDQAGALVGPAPIN